MQKERHREAALEIDKELPILNGGFPDLPDIEIALYCARFSILNRDRHRYI